MPLRYARNTQADLVSNIPAGKRLHIFVQDPANNIFLSRMKSSLESSTPGSTGLKVNNASGTVEINWQGEVWAIGDAPSVAFEVSVD